MLRTPHAQSIRSHQQGCSLDTICGSCFFGRQVVPDYHKLPAHLALAADPLNRCVSHPVYLSRCVARQLLDSFDLSQVSRSTGGAVRRDR